MIETKLPGCIYRGPVANEDGEFPCSCEQREQAPATLEICLACPFRAVNHFDVANQLPIHETSSPEPLESQPATTGFFEKISEAVHGAIGATKAYLGLDATPDDERQKRYELCAACPENDCGQCRLCHCPVGAKIRVASQSCPIQKWLAVEKA